MCTIFKQGRSIKYVFLYLSFKVKAIKKYTIQNNLSPQVIKFVKYVTFMSILPLFSLLLYTFSPLLFFLSFP